MNSEESFMEWLTDEELEKINHQNVIINAFDQFSLDDWVHKLLAATQNKPSISWYEPEDSTEIKCNFKLSPGGKLDAIAQKNLKAILKQNKTQLYINCLSFQGPVYTQKKGDITLSIAIMKDRYNEDYVHQFLNQHDHQLILQELWRVVKEKFNW